MITADVQPEIRPEVTRKMRKSFENPPLLMLAAWQAADYPDVTDKNRSIKPRMNTNSDELRRQKPICKKLVFIGVYSWLTLPESCLDRVIRVILGEVHLGASEATIFSEAQIAVYRRQSGNHHDNTSWYGTCPVNCSSLVRIFSLAGRTRNGL